MATLGNRTIEEKFVRSFCVLLDFPDDGIDCRRNNSLSCVQCKSRGVYLTGESINDYDSTALKISYFVWILLLLVSIFGCFGNVMIITVIRRLKSHMSFDFLLTALACADLYCSVMASVLMTGVQAYYGNF